MPVLLPSDALQIVESAVDERPTVTALRVLAAAYGSETLHEFARLPIGARDRLLLELRQQSLGGPFTARECCPGCSTELELRVEASDLIVDTGSDAERLELRCGGLSVCFRLPTSEDMLSLESLTDEHEATRQLAARCIEAAERGGLPIDGDELSDAELEALDEAMAAADPQADMTLDLRCSNCSQRWKRELDPATYFIEELTVVSRRLLDEVCVLASGFGWSEADILSMSAWRRQTYVQMLGR